jgi:site-specific DNA-methyltransferase (adenine-specific)
MLWQGDCIDAMNGIPDECVDIIFTDPPYKMVGGGRKNTLLTDTPTTPFSGDGECFNTKTPKFIDWIPIVYQKLQNNRYAFIMTNDRNMREIWDVCENVGFRFCELLVMDKGRGVPSTYFYKSCEFILMFMKGKYRRFNKYGVKTVFNVDLPRGKEKTHPTEKPPRMIEAIISSVTLENEVVLDPFMGSGSTGVAALNTKRNFIGIELEPTYCGIAKQRILDIVCQCS